MGCAEVILETETTNTIALSLYEKLGFARDERLFKYYLNGADAFRLCLPLAREDFVDDGLPPSPQAFRQLSAAPPPGAGSGHFFGIALSVIPSIGVCTDKIEDRQISFSGARTWRALHRSGLLMPRAHPALPASSDCSIHPPPGRPAQAATQPAALPAYTMFGSVSMVA